MKTEERRRVRIVVAATSGGRSVRWGATCSTCGVLASDGRESNGSPSWARRLAATHGQSPEHETDSVRYREDKPAAAARKRKRAKR